jgi:hypothetical protein
MYNVGEARIGSRILRRQNLDITKINEILFISRLADFSEEKVIEIGKNIFFFFPRFPVPQVKLVLSDSLFSQIGIILIVQKKHS